MFSPYSLNELRLTCSTALLISTFSIPEKPPKKSLNITLNFFQSIRNL